MKRFSVIVSADAEWESVKPLFPDAQIERSPYGEYFFAEVIHHQVLFFHGYEAMGDSHLAIDHYSTDLEVPAGLPSSVIRATMYSADRDLTPLHLPELNHRYHPRVVDWESGAIAWVAKRNGTPLLILRGVTDLVRPNDAEAQGNLQLFRENAQKVIQSLVGDLPKYLNALLSTTA